MSQRESCTPSSGVPMELPKCKEHGAMELRDPKMQTKEQQWCGVWYRCRGCMSSVLFPSPAVRALYASKGIAL